MSAFHPKPTPTIRAAKPHPGKKGTLPVRNRLPLAGAPVRRFVMQERADSEFLLTQAARCRRLACSISDSAMTAKLRDLAVEFEAQANGRQHLAEQISSFDVPRRY